jgi:hypothetical protein
MPRFGALSSVGNQLLNPSKKSVAKVVTPSGEGRGMRGRGMVLMGM